MQSQSRGGERTNISKFADSLYDFSDRVQDKVMQELNGRLSGFDDKVQYVFHDSPYIVTGNVRREMATSVPFYPLDKDLTQQDIEAINLYGLGFFPIEATAINLFILVTVKNIVATVEDKLAAGAKWVKVHFAPADSVRYANTIAKPMYVFIAGNTLETETSFFVEAIND